jgi:hypothetical protein
MLVVVAACPARARRPSRARSRPAAAPPSFRVDAIEQAMRPAGVLAAGGEVGPAGYMALPPSPKRTCGSAFPSSPTA